MTIFYLQFGYVLVHLVENIYRTSFLNSNPIEFYVSAKCIIHSMLQIVSLKNQGADI